MKRCPTCKAEKPLADFHKNRLHASGLASECKVCVGVRVKAWKELNIEKVKARAKERYEKTQDQQRERAREWHHANKERSSAQGAVWRAANKAKIKATKRLAATGFTDALVTEALRLQANACGICKADLSQVPPRHVHADHDHATGAPRGVLCHHCNVGLGYFRDSCERLRAALAYLASPPLGATA